MISLADFLALPEYSMTLPTGTTIGKRWRARAGAGWQMGEYVEPAPDQRFCPHTKREMVAIRWRPLHIIADEELG